MENIFAKTQCLSAQDVQQYLKATLSKGENHRVERHLIDCPLCSAAVEGLANQHNFEEHLEFQKIQEAINPKTQQKNSTVNTKIKSLPRKSSYRGLFSKVAAAILLCILPFAAYLYWQENEGERLFQVYYQRLADDALIAQRATAITEFKDPDLKRGMDYFNLKAYFESLGYFQEVLKKDPENPSAIFFTGMASLEVGKYQKAIHYLSLSRINHADHYEQATWYLILAHLKENNQSTVSELLEDMMNSEDSDYRKKAVQLKEALLEEQ